MFTGLIRHLGTLESRSSRPGGARLRFAATADLLTRAKQGASIAVNGACLTSVAVDARAWEADLSEETLAKTTLGRLPLGVTLHLEPALCVGDPLDGHLVSGHVDGRAEVLETSQEGGSQRLSCRVPPGLQRYIARKGSVSLDGVSLTVNEVEGADFSVNLIPHTLAVTTLGALRRGARLNLEIDIIARYAERLLTPGEIER